MKKPKPLDGYKTYIVAAVTIAVAIFFYTQGELEAPAAIAMILGALGAGSLRHGIH